MIEEILLKNLLNLSTEHYAYVMGYKGLDPDSNFDSSSRYEIGYLQGYNDRDDESMSWLCNLSEINFNRNETIYVPKGIKVSNIKHGLITTKKSYIVKIHDFYKIQPAHIWGSEFYKPKPPKVIWAGRGGYWSEASAFDVKKH